MKTGKRIYPNNGSAQSILGFQFLNYKNIVKRTEKIVTANNNM